MPLDFSCNGFEGLFRKALEEGICLFCGAGFSVEAEDSFGKKLPVGAALLDELKAAFPSISVYSLLPRACTKLNQTQRAEFNAFLKQRFKVERYNPLYNALLGITIKHIYTTNIDDLFFRVFESSNTLYYLNDKSQKGASYDDRFAIEYYPLHGCVRNEESFVFGATDLVTAFSRRGNEQSWKNLADDAAKRPILFWGWNFSDPSPIQAMFGNGNQLENNTQRWVLLRKRDPETTDFLISLGFNIIIGDTIEMLQYLDEISRLLNSTREQKNDNAEIDTELFSQYLIPENNDLLPSYPLNTFFLEYAPRWSHIYSGSVPKTSNYKTIADSIARGEDTIVIGVRASGKTTLMMQLLYEYETNKPKHYMIAPSYEQARVYTKLVGNKSTILFIDDCFRDTNAVLYLLQISNIQVVCFDRDYNYERQYHLIRRLSFNRIDVSEITMEDAQSIIDIIPSELKREKTSMKKFEKDPLIMTLLISHLRAVNFRFINRFYKEDPEAARVYLMISYVQACGTPCSFDMIYSFLGDDHYTWEQMFDIIERIGGLVKDVTNEKLVPDIKESVQNYYSCRSRYFNEELINGITENNREVFARVLYDFALYVLPYKICMYDKFKRNAYDADFSSFAFPDTKDGTDYYNICVQRDESEYIFQQAAIYFARKKEYKTAFNWIEKARNLSHYNRFSIDSTYAKIYFDANLEADREQTAKALSILKSCCTNDRRKSIHFETFAECCKKFWEKYPDSDAVDYVDDAISYINEGINDTNISLSEKRKKRLIKLKKDLEVIIVDSES